MLKNFFEKMLQKNLTFSDIIVLYIIINVRKDCILEKIEK